MPLLKTAAAKDQPKSALVLNVIAPPVSKTINRTGFQMKIQKIIGLIAMACSSYFGSVHAESAQDLGGMVAASPPYERHHYKKECSNFSEETKRFSDKLSDANLKIFCEDFNDAQRQQAIQMASQKGMNMTPDQAVEMVAAKKK